MSDNKNNKIKLHGKISQFPKNTNKDKARNFLENIKISKKKLWYFLIEKDDITNDDCETQLQMIKYNNKKGVNCIDFVKELKNYYSKNEELKPLVDNLIVEGEEDYSIIRNIPDVEINGVKFITIITKDLIKLLK